MTDPFPMWNWLRENYGWQAKRRDWIILGVCLTAIALVMLGYMLGLEAARYGL